MKQCSQCCVVDMSNPRSDRIGEARFERTEILEERRKVSLVSDAEGPEDAPGGEVGAQRVPLQPRLTQHGVNRPSCLLHTARPPDVLEEP